MIRRALLRYATTLPWKNLMPIPTAPLSALPTTWTAHTAPAYTEQDPGLEQRSRSAQTYFSALEMYAEDTHPDSVRQLESRRPASLPPTYWQATSSDSPLPEHDASDELPPTYEQATGTGSSNEDAVSFSPHLSGRALSQAMKHVYRLDHLLKQAEQLGTLLLDRDTSIDVGTVAALCQQIDRLRSSWANGAFAGSSQLGTQLAGHCFPVPRALKENALKAAIDNLWNVAKTEYRDLYLSNPLHADPVLAKVYSLVEGLKNTEI